MTQITHCDNEVDSQSGNKMSKLSIVSQAACTKWWLSSQWSV